MDEDFSIRKDLCSKLANIQLEETVVNECKNFVLNYESIKEVYPWFVKNIDGEEYLDLDQFIGYMFGALKETYNLLYDTRVELDDLRRQIEELKKTDK